VRTINTKLIRVLVPAAAAASGVLAGAIMWNVIVTLAHPAPQVGDIVAFIPSAATPADDGTRLIVHRQDQSGGSLLIENQTAASPPSFNAHWAGARTSADAADCGPQADLIVDRLDLAILSFSAGGYATTPRRAFARG
jgi:hypothetical protein